jgi:ATP-dependent Zn protease
MLPAVACAQVKEMLSRNRPALDALAAALLDKEQLQGHDVYKLLEPHLTETDLAARQQAAEEMAFL